MSPLRCDGIAVEVVGGLPREGERTPILPPDADWACALADLRKAHEQLEQRIRERTQELSRANARLGHQIVKRKKVEAARTDLLRRLVHAQEEEHRRIARELHDDLTQRLAILAIDTGTLELLPSLPAEVQQRLRDMREQLVSLSESVHT